MIQSKVENVTVITDNKTMTTDNGELITDSHQQVYHSAIDVLRKRAAHELDGGFRAHHNALIYAANVLENAQAFAKEAS